jgi:3-hydroxyisobutyrate dehydrogenase-like beta-hydroxyacid dehydrogenase
VIDLEKVSRDYLIGRNVGLIGVGKMGLGIGVSLIRNGAQVICCGNRSRAGIEELLSLGAAEVCTPKRVAERCNILVLSLPDSKAVDSVCFGSDGIAASNHEKLLVIDTTTGNPAQTLNIVTSLKSCGVDYVDAPVTRGPQQARQGKLNAVLGTPERLLGTSCSVLKAFCDFIIHVGDVSQAQKVKLVNNALSMGVVALTADTISLSQEIGVDVRHIAQLIAQGGVNNALSQTFLKWVCEGGPEPLEFSINNALKDLTYSLNLVPSTGAALKMITAAQQAFADKARAGYGENNLPALVRR